MQLTLWGRSSVAGLLLVAATGSAWAQQEAPKEAPSTVDVNATLDYGQYADTDHVFVETPSLRGIASSPTEGWSVDGQYLVDIVSAASADIVSTASRRWNEVRQEGELGMVYKPHEWGLDVNGSLSDEPDFLTFTAGAAVSQDVADKNATWLFGYSYGHDIAGRTGTPFSVFSHALRPQRVSRRADARAEPLEHRHLRRGRRS